MLNQLNETLNTLKLRMDDFNKAHTDFVNLGLQSAAILVEVAKTEVGLNEINEAQGRLQAAAEAQAKANEALKVRAQQMYKELHDAGKAPQQNVTFEQLEALYNEVFGTKDAVVDAEVVEENQGKKGKK